MGRHSATRAGRHRHRAPARQLPHVRPHVRLAVVGVLVALGCAPVVTASASPAPHQPPTPEHVRLDVQASPTPTTVVPGPPALPHMPGSAAPAASPAAAHSQPARQVGDDDWDWDEFASVARQFEDESGWTAKNSRSKHDN